MEERGSRWLPQRTKFYEAPSGRSTKVELPSTADALLNLYSGTSNGDWHVLVYNPQTNSQANSTPWEMASWNSRSKQLVKLDSPSGGPIPSLSADHDLLAYSAPGRTVATSTDLNTYIRHIDGSDAAKVLEPNATAVALVWPFAFVVKPIESTASSTATSSTDPYQIVRIDLRTNVRSEISSTTAGRGAFTANESHLFIGHMNGNVDVTDLNGTRVATLTLPHTQFGMASPLDDGFMFIGSSTSDESGYSAVLIEDHHKWKFIVLSRRDTTDLAHAGQNITGNGKCVYWVDGRSGVPSPDKSLGDPLLRRINHFATIDSIIKAATPISAGK
jgi:hypothetical protein